MQRELFGELCFSEMAIRTEIYRERASTLSDGGGHLKMILLLQIAIFRTIERILLEIYWTTRSPCRRTCVLHAPCRYRWETDVFSTHVHVRVIRELFSRSGHNGVYWRTTIFISGRGICFYLQSDALPIPGKTPGYISPIFAGIHAVEICPKDFLRTMQKESRLFERFLIAMNNGGWRNYF